MVQLAVSKDAVSKRGRPPGLARERNLSMEESRNELFKGVSMGDMTIIFRLDRRTIQAKIADVPACGKRRGNSIWLIRDVAPYLIRPAGDIEEHIKRMRPNDLPPQLNKEFWNGQRSKLRYQEEIGMLWRTDRVLEVLSKVFQTIKMNLLLVPDAIERKSSLSDQQREEVRLAIDGTLVEIRDALIGQFENDTQETTYEEQPKRQDDVFADEFDAEEYDDTFDTPELDTGDL